MAKFNPKTVSAKLNDALKPRKSKSSIPKKGTSKQNIVPRRRRSVAGSSTGNGNGNGNSNGLRRSESVGLQEEIIEDYLFFRQRLKEIEKERENYSPRPEIFLLFSGSYEFGRSWCGLCNPVNEYIKTQIVPRYRKRGYLLWVRVGPFEEWAKRSNPYRRDPKINIQRIPAMIVWGTEKKMQGIDMILFGLVKEAFGLSFEDEEETQQTSIT